MAVGRWTGILHRAWGRDQPGCNRRRLLYMDGHYIPANTKHLYNICTTSSQRLRRWADVVQMLYKCFTNVLCLPGYWSSVLWNTTYYAPCCRQVTNVRGRGRGYNFLLREKWSWVIFLAMWNKASWPLNYENCIAIFPIKCTKIRIIISPMRKFY